MVGLHKVEAEL